MANPATKKRGGNPDVQHKPEGQKPKDAMERKLEQGLEESMTGSDPSVSLNRQRASMTKRKRAEALRSAIEQPAIPCQVSLN